MPVQIRKYEIGCEPSPSVPAETVIQDGWKTYVLFLAVSSELNPSGYLDDLGVAVLECHHCVMARFGYPNDEGLPEHPLYRFGMSEVTSSILEVLNSAWAREVDAQRGASAQRIWGGYGISPDWLKTSDPSRHFILLLKEKTFECLATSMKVERFCPTFAEAITFVMARLSEH